MSKAKPKDESKNSVLSGVAAWSIIAPEGKQLFGKQLAGGPTIMSTSIGKEVLFELNLRLETCWKL